MELDFSKIKRRGQRVTPDLSRLGCRKWPHDSSPAFLLHHKRLTVAQCIFFAPERLSAAGWLWNSSTVYEPQPVNTFPLRTFTLRLGQPSSSSCSSSSLPLSLTPVAFFPCASDPSAVALQSSSSHSFDSDQPLVCPSLVCPPCRFHPMIIFISLSPTIKGASIWVRSRFIFGFLYRSNRGLRSTSSCCWWAKELLILLAKYPKKLKTASNTSPIFDMTFNMSRSRSFFFFFLVGWGGAVLVYRYYDTVKKKSDWTA